MRLLRRDVHALAGVYALDALDPGAERDWFSRHLNRCQSCASEVRGFREVATALAFAAAAERTRSMARRWAMVITHVAAPPTAGSNRAAVRHTSRRTSWATSSDWDGSLSTRRITPYTGPASRSYTASNAD